MSNIKTTNEALSLVGAIIDATVRGVSFGADAIIIDVVDNTPPLYIRAELCTVNSSAFVDVWSSREGFPDVGRYTNSVINDWAVDFAANIAADVTRMRANVTIADDVEVLGPTSVRDVCDIIADAAGGKFMHDTRYNNAGDLVSVRIERACRLYIAEHNGERVYMTERVHTDGSPFDSIGVVHTNATDAAKAALTTIAHASVDRVVAKRNFTDLAKYAATTPFDATVGGGE